MPCSDCSSIQAEQNLMFLLCNGSCTIVCLILINDTVSWALLGNIHWMVVGWSVWLYFFFLQCFVQHFPLTGYNPLTCSVSLPDYQNICAADKQTVACSSINSVLSFLPDSGVMLWAQWAGVYSMKPWEAQGWWWWAAIVPAWSCAALGWTPALHWLFFLEATLQNVSISLSLSLSYTHTHTVKCGCTKHLY